MVWNQGKNSEVEKSKFYCDFSNYLYSQTVIFSFVVMIFSHPSNGEKFETCQGIKKGVPISLSMILFSLWENYKLTPYLIF